MGNLLKAKEALCFRSGKMRLVITFALLALMVPGISADSPMPRRTAAPRGMRTPPSLFMKELASKIEINGQHQMGLLIATTTIALVVMSLASVLVAKMKHFEVSQRANVQFVEAYNEKYASASASNLMQGSGETEDEVAERIKDKVLASLKTELQPILREAMNER